MKDEPVGLLALLGKKPKGLEKEEASEAPEAQLTAASALREALKSGTDEELLEALKNVGCFH